MLLAIDVVQIIYWLKTRNQKTTTGPESLAGAQGVAVTDCHPRGQVRVRGDIWKAYCPEGVDEGAKVTVLSLEGLEITVAPRTGAST